MVPDLTAHDAVGNDAAGMYRTLKDAGYDVSLFTIEGLSASPWKTLKYWDAAWRLSEPDDLLIYHYCTTDPLARSVLRRLRCRIAMKYHNVTPSRFMAPYSSLLTMATRNGRMMLGDFVDQSFDWFIGDSQYNAQEILDLTDGTAQVDVLAPFHQVADLMNCGEEPGTLSYLRQYPTNILSVGRIVPNKGHIAMLHAFGRYLRTHEHRPHLHFVGSHDERVAPYIARLRAIVAQYDMDDCVSFHPTVGAEALATFYRYSDFYWTASEHEGFCVPVIEAMGFGLPVLSSRHGALADTCGSAALLCDTPAEIDAGLERLLGDDDALLKLKRRGLARYDAEFRPEVVKRRFLAFVDTWAKGVPEPSTMQLDAEDEARWFGLPRPLDLLAIIAATTGHPTGALHARDRRLDLVRWVLSTGQTESAALADYVRSPELARYAAQLAVPPKAAYLSPAARLAWFFSRDAQERYPLGDIDNIAGYLRWFWRRGLNELNLHDLLTRTEMRLSGDQIVA